MDQLTRRVPRYPTTPPVRRTRAVEFWETTVVHLGESAAVAGLGQFPVVTLLTVPGQVDRVEVQRMAVHGTPAGFFCNSCWWTLLIEVGGAQEFLTRSNIDMSDTGLASALPLRAAGVRHANFGALGDPRPVNIELRQGSRLQLQVTAYAAWTGANVRPMTVYCGIGGISHYEA